MLQSKPVKILSLSQRKCPRIVPSPLAEIRAILHALRAQGLRVQSSFVHPKVMNSSAGIKELSFIHAD